MQFEPHVLSAPLTDHIESIFHFKNFEPDHSIERVVPTGHVFIIFELDDFVRNTFDNDTLKPKESFTKVWISGMHRNYISISSHQKSEMFVIQFKPFGAYPFFHFPLEELTGKVVPAETVLGNEILALRESLYNTDENSDKFQLAEKWLLDRFDEQKRPSKDLLDVASKLQEVSAAGINDAMTSYPNTQKHLIDQCKKYLGLTPKYFHRIIRFNEMLVLLKEQKKIQWSQVAYQCGYSDQSHFIKEFKHFSGFNPQEFIEEHHKDEPNFFPLDREG
ncbi:MAG: AraC family transcriptional regulator [Reichenbachiella sp.]|uniref:AraC family transcriptional regulator n=1 Tax=Reichenbachiella sp. TaxID=2184521 RepID=UPI003262E966